MTAEIRLPRIYALLKAAGHDAAKAAEILIDAQRKDAHARIWIRTIAASRRSSSRIISDKARSPLTRPALAIAVTRARACALSACS